MKNYLIIIWFMSFAVMTSCQSEKKNRPVGQMTVATEVELPDDFLEFYQRFHSDSLFQMNHILFPLPERDNLIEKNGKFWSSDDWIMHRGEYFNEKEYTLEFERATDQFIFEYQRHKTMPFAVERRWLRDGETWQLIYYKTHSK